MTEAYICDFCDERIHQDHAVSLTLMLTTSQRVVHFCSDCYPGSPNATINTALRGIGREVSADAGE